MDLISQTFVPWLNSAQQTAIFQSAIAGLAAGLAVALILGAMRFRRQWWGRRQDVKDIRDLLTQGRTRVFEAKDTYHPGMKVMLKENEIRAAQYNIMLMQLGITLERWAVHLSHDDRKDIYEALDWYHTQSLFAAKSRCGGSVEFPPLSEGRWPTKEMSEDQAKEKFKNLAGIQWLKMKPGFWTRWWRKLTSSGQ